MSKITAPELEWILLLLTLLIALAASLSMNSILKPSWEAKHSSSRIANNYATSIEKPPLILFDTACTTLPSWSRATHPRPTDAGWTGRPDAIDRFAQEVSAPAPASQICYPFWLSGWFQGFLIDFFWAFFKFRTLF